MHIMILDPSDEEESFKCKIRAVLVRSSRLSMYILQLKQ